MILFFAIAISPSRAGLWDDQKAAFFVFNISIIIKPIWIANAGHWYLQKVKRKAVGGIVVIHHLSFPRLLYR